MNAHDPDATYTFETFEKELEGIDAMIAAERTDHIHTWVVFSTAVEDGWLMLQCVDCGLHGVVKDPTKKEWSKAYRAPSRPYVWSIASRVVPQPQVACEKRYVVRAETSQRCECYEQRGILEPHEYERFPMN